MRLAVSLLAVLALTGCKKQKPDQETGPSLETGWFTDSSDSGLCIDRVLETAPEAGDGNWYWRNGPKIITTSPEHDLYEFRLLTSDLAVVPTTTTWADNGLNATLELPDPLEPAADYQLEVTDCTGSRRLPFTTADYGLPLDGGPASLKNRTWVIDLTQADW